MSQTTHSTQDDPDLQQIDHVIRLFQKAHKSQSKQNIKLTLGLKMVKSSLCIQYTQQRKLQERGTGRNIA